MNYKKPSEIEFSRNYNKRKISGKFSTLVQSTCSITKDDDQLNICIFALYISEEEGGFT